MLATILTSKHIGNDFVGLTIPQLPEMDYCLSSDITVILAGKKAFTRGSHAAGGPDWTRPFPPDTHARAWRLRHTVCRSIWSPTLPR